MYECDNFGNVSAGVLFSKVGGKRSNYHCERFEELAVQSFHVGNSIFINLFDKTKFSFHKLLRINIGKKYW